EGRRANYPFDLKDASGMYISESADRPVLSFRLAIAAHTRQMTAGNQNDTPSEYNHRDPIKVESHFYHYDAPTDPFGFNKIQGELQGAHRRASRFAGLWRRRRRPLLAVIARF